MTTTIGKHGDATGAGTERHPSEDTARPVFSLTQADVAEFRELLNRECGITLDAGEAWNRATELVALFRMLLGPIPEDPVFEQSSNVVAVAWSAPGKLR